MSLPNLTSSLPLISMTREHPKAILFDWDITLVDTFDLIYSSVNATMRQFNKPEWSVDQVKKYTHSPAQEWLTSLFADQWEDALAFFRKQYVSQHLVYLKPMEGAKSLLGVLNSLRIPLGIVSNKHGHILRKEVEHLGWDSYFGTILGSGDVAEDKPAPDMALKALQELGVEPCPQRTWLIGDSPADWQCAEAAGCKPIPMGDEYPESKQYPQGVKNCSELELVFIG